MNRRVPVVSAIAFALLLIGFAAAPAFAAGPQLSATTQAGREIDVTGSGFPANAAVQLVIQRHGTPALSGGTGTEGSGTQTLHTDASGSFTATIPAGPGRGGRYTLTARSGSATATISIVAVETAGGLAGGTQPTPPSTDTRSAASASGEASASNGMAADGPTMAFGWAFLLVAVLGLTARLVAEPRTVGRDQPR